MAILAASDVTVTLPSGNRDIGGGGVFKNISVATIAFGNGVLTYATGGVPLPPLGMFGLKRVIDAMLIEQPPANGFEYRYDRATHRVRIFTQGFSTGGTAAAAAETGALVRNSVGVEAIAPRMPRTVASTTYDMGPMIELPAGTAPAAVSFSALVIGK